MDFSISHEFDCDVERYWKTFFDEEYNRALYQELDIRERTVVERHEEDSGNVIHRLIRIVPSAEMPAVVQKVVGGPIAYVEKSTWRKAKSELYVRIELDAGSMRDKFKLSGTYSVAPIGPNRVRRDFSATLHVAIPLLGGQIEKFVAESIRKNYETTAAFTHRWLAEHT